MPSCLSRAYCASASPTTSGETPSAAVFRYTRPSRDGKSRRRVASVSMGTPGEPRASASGWDAEYHPLADARGSPKATSVHTRRGLLDVPGRVLGGGFQFRGRAVKRDLPLGEVRGQGLRLLAVDEDALHRAVVDRDA